MADEELSFKKWKRAANSAITSDVKSDVRGIHSDRSSISSRGAPLQRHESSSSTFARENNSRSSVDASGLKGDSLGPRASQSNPPLSHQRVDHGAPKTVEDHLRTFVSNFVTAAFHPGNVSSNATGRDGASRTSSQPGSPTIARRGDPMGAGTGSGSQITRAHWKPDALAMHCAHPGCRVVFSLTDRKHHCRKCGDVFCAIHSDCVMKLDANAGHDVDNGTLQKVCFTCFESREGYAPTLGVTTRHLQHFLRHRRHHIDALTRYSDELSGRLSTLADLRAENVSGSALRSREMALVVWRPDWMSDTCTSCGVAFGLFLRRHHCRLCGTIICEECCSLGPHTPRSFGGANTTYSATKPKVPPPPPPPPHPRGPVEVRVCTGCLERLEWREKREMGPRGRTSMGGLDFGDERPPVCAMYQKLRATKAELEQKMYEWHELTESINAAAGRLGGGDRNGGDAYAWVDDDGGQRAADNTPLSPILDSRRTNAKDVVTKLFVLYQELGTRISRLPARCETEKRVHSNINLAVCQYLQENKFGFLRATVRDREEGRSSPSVSRPSTPLRTQPARIKDAM
eukprot:Opistho-2@58449